MFSAYTVKKIVPRLLIAAVMIQLSWFVVIEIININNNIAHGIEGLMYAPFGGIDKFLSLGSLIQSAGSVFAFEATAGVFLAVAAAGSFATGGGSILGILALAATAALGILIALFTLVLRQAVLLFLVIISPVAIVAWVLPGTERFWKLWWETFSKLLLVYPLILMAIAAGRIFAYVSANSSTNQMLAFILVVLGFFGPLFMIPAMMKLAGSVFATIGGVVNNRGKGMFDRLRNARGNAAKSAQERRFNGKTFRGGTERNLRGAINRGVQAGMLVPSKGGLNVAKWGQRVGAAMSDGSMMQREEMMNDKEYTWKGNDDLNRFAAMSANEAELRRLMEQSGNYANNPAGRENMQRDIARVENMRRKYGNSAFRQAAWFNALKGGTAFDNPNSGNVNAWEVAASVAGNDDALLADMVGQGRSMAVGAGRVDQGGAGFMDTYRIAQQFRTNPNYTGDQARQDLARHVYDSQGAGTLLHPSMKPNAVAELAPQMNEAVRNGLATGNTRDAAQSLASLGAVYDAMASSSPNKARILADNVMNEEIDLRTVTPELRQILGPAAVVTDPVTGVQHSKMSVTFQEAIEAFRASGNGDFLQMRREYGSQFERQAQQAASQPQGPGAPPTTPPITPPGGTP